MRLFNGRLTEEDNATISTWRKRMIAFYSILLIIMAAILAIDMRQNKYLANEAGNVSALTASATK